jgi:hypothetical protein
LNERKCVSSRALTVITNDNVLYHSLYEPYVKHTSNIPAFAGSCRLLIALHFNSHSILRGACGCSVRLWRAILCTERQMITHSKRIWRRWSSWSLPTKISIFGTVASLLSIAL